MRLAVLADIHGNLPALEAVLAEVERESPDAIVLNGDVADGPFPAETLDRLTALGDRAIWVRGNGDRWLAEAHDGTYRPRGGEPDALMAWAARRLTRQHRDRLAGLPLTATVHHPVLGRIGVCHATARHDNEMLLVDSPLDHARDALAGLDAPTVLLGHSHMPFDRLFDRRRVVNPGSVGMPYGHEGAAWAMIDHAITLRRTPYDVAAAAGRIAESGMPDAHAFAREYVLTTASDREAMEAFQGTRLRQQATGLYD